MMIILMLCTFYSNNINQVGCIPLLSLPQLSHCVNVSPEVILHTRNERIQINTIMFHKITGIAFLSLNLLLAV